jgi:hypothetical protein
MSHLKKVQQLAEGFVGAGPDRRNAVFGYLSDQPDSGVPAALECVFGAKDTLTVEYVSQYLALVPGRCEAKTRVAEALRQDPNLAPSASWLVPWLPDELISGFIADYLEAPAERAQLADVLYEVGVCFPGKLRPYTRRIDDDYVQRALFAGGPDSMADGFLSVWRNTGELRSLIAMALMRTERAVHHLMEVRGELADVHQWETLLELSGRLPGDGGKAGSFPAFMGFVAEPGASRHVIGETTHGVVPLCPDCESPAVSLLRLRVADLPFSLSAAPEFFWYACDCQEAESLTVGTGSDELRAYDAPQGPADPESRISPGVLSLVLEEHPNQVGVSLRANPGSSRHQVGGLPRWVEPDRHPVCPECEQAMPYLATVDSGKTPYGDMEFDGVLYCFWCDGCRVSSTQVQY